ncbi:MAG: hypothetical protein M1818_007661 [Claussenomyces sp. TS43310]|nr:MAG: hypothetical protein M1818_007661 [Claussenomyces sp. TS43310]
MTLPTPNVPLDNVCSTIWNNTLYTYSENAFQSLPLVKGAQWSRLSMGVPVTGGVCVQATPQNDSTPAALYIVGGTAKSSDSYMGIQRYRFSDAVWETLTPTAAVAENRLYHNALYLNDSSSILMYSGTQDGSKQPSSETFMISTSPPYDVVAYGSMAPPVVSPLLLNWNAGQAVMFGGSNANNKVMVFGPDIAWIDSGTTLAHPPESDSDIKAVMMFGDDGSKHLYTFDMTTSPNSVNRTVLVDGYGNPISNAEAIVSRSIAELEVEPTSQVLGLDKRGNLTVADWPPYNSTLAPTTTRDNYSVSMDASGLVVISGGNSDDVLCIFNAKDNSWANATSMLSKTSVHAGPEHTASAILSSTSTALSSSTATSVPTASTSSAASSSHANSGSRAFALKVLGIVLGTIVGVALILVLALLFFRWRRNKRRFEEAGHQRRASGIPKGEKDLVSGPNKSNHGQQGSQNSFSSMAVLMGKVNTPQRGMLGRQKGSNGSDASSTFNKRYRTAISNPIPQDTFESRNVLAEGGKSGAFRPAPVAAPAPVPRPRSSANGRRGSTRRSSGWNRYWSGGSALNILGFGSKRAADDSGSDRNSDSQYSDADLPAPNTQNPRTLQQSDIPPPLKLDPPRGRLQRVASGSPTIAHAAGGFPFKEEMSGQIERHPSVSSLSSYEDRRDAFSSGVPASEYDHEPWTPVGGIQHWGVPPDDRIPSIVYSESSYAGSTAGAQPSQNVMRAFPEPPGHRPRQPQSQLQNSSDMSWLNLGGSSEHS